MNHVSLIGRLTRDPEMRYTPNGVAVTTFTLAVNRPFTNQEGQREADFINIVAWRQLAELCANYLRKGRQTGVEGRLQIRSYENQEGKRVYVTEVVAERVHFLEKAQDSNADSRKEDHDPFAPADSLEDPFAGPSKTIDISDDDLPF